MRTTRARPTTTPTWPPRRTARRPLAPHVTAPREPYDPARVVRRWARGIGAGAVAAALEDAWFNARQASQHKDLADEVRGLAALAEWERIAELLAAADAAAAADREAELREALRISARADQLQALRDLGILDQAEPAEGDETVRDALATHRGHYADPAAREAAFSPRRFAHRPERRCCGDSKPSFPERERWRSSFGTIKGRPGSPGPRTGGER
ncbi:hypothetical protein ACTVZO_41460 [Streptomyces sp. IBSNAI002]|uniref:hypothetical protein n=1 Tax=Streptomyces sp. IBSNAI002 TaxID=3457500 RepID=UPI003FD2488C